MSTPGFLEKGIDFEQLIYHYEANNYNFTITDPTEVNLATDLMIHVINSSFGYDTGFASTVPGRIQMIFNSTLQELTLEKIGLSKQSNAVWLLDGKYERGTDFKLSDGTGIEAKVYRDKDSMLKAAREGTLDYKVFHGADYVICYLINGEVTITAEYPFREVQHWFWLKKVNGEYVEYSDSELTELINKKLPTALPVCRCMISDDKIIICKNIYCN